jgi:hypothetical protein
MKKIPDDVLRKAAKELGQYRKGKRFLPESWEDKVMDFSSVGPKPKSQKRKPKKKKRT